MLKRKAESTETISHPLPRQCTRCRTTLPLMQTVVNERHESTDMLAGAFDLIAHGK